MIFKKSLFAGLTTILLLAGFCIGVCAAPTQIYTDNCTAVGVTAKGGLYGNRTDNYIVSASSTTYASGSTDYKVDVTTTVYGAGSKSGSASQAASQGASAQSGTIIMTKDNNCTTISSSHSATVYAATATAIYIPSLVLNVNQMN